MVHVQTRLESRNQHHENYEMKILAFLQNPWFRPGTQPRHIKMYAENQDFHRRVLLLSATGRALIRAFGAELYHKIIWENANPRHGHDRRAKMPHDIGHMAGVIVRHRPDLILCFGDEAKNGMKKLMSEPWPNVLHAPHPMAHGSAADHLKEISEEVKRRLKAGHK